MKALGIVAIIGGLVLIVVTLAGLSTAGGMAPQIVMGTVIAVIGVLLMRRPARKP